MNNDRVFFKIKYETVIKLLLLINFFFPTFNNVFESTGDTGVMMINLMMFSLSLFTICFIVRDYGFKFEFGVNAFLIVAFLYFILTISGNLINSRVIISDAFELFRPVYYTVSFLLFYLLVRINAVRPEKIIKIISCFILATAFFSFICLLFYQYFGREVMAFYAKTSLLSTRRFTGTFQNPYDFAFVAVLPLMFLIMKFVTEGKVYRLIGILVLFMTILFGQSKSGFASFLVATSIALLASLFIVNRDTLRKSIGYHARFLFFPASVVIFATIIVLFYFDAFSYLLNGIIKIISGDGDKSTQIRIYQAKMALDMLENNALELFMGFGSFKDSGLKFESLYSLYLFRYGFLAVVILFFWIIFPIVILAFQKVELEKLYKVLLFGLFFSVIPAGFGNNVIDQSRIPFIYFGCLGVTYALIHKRTVKRSV
ncbi:hypothetical protein ACXHQ9_11815 [Vibrio cincinnatiensis]